MLDTLVITLLLLIALGSVGALYWFSKRKNELIEKMGSTLLVIAHPGDEAMYFGPAICAYNSIAKPLRSRIQSDIGSKTSPSSSSTSSSPANSVSSTSSITDSSAMNILCFCNGNAGGLGKLREKELLDCAMCFDIPPENVSLVEDEELKDGPNEVWNQEKIKQGIATLIKERNIRTVISFDENSASGHPNHKALHDALASIPKSEQSSQFWKLKTFPIWQKYLSFFAILNVIFLFFSDPTFKTSAAICVAFFPDYERISDGAQKHRTQMDWLRKFHVVASSYMFVNILEPFK